MKNAIAILGAVLLGAGFWPLSIAQTTLGGPPDAETPAGQTPPADSPPAATARSVSSAGGVIYLGREAAYADVDRIDQAILRECQLPQRQAEFIAAAATSAGFNVVHDEQAVKARKGRVLHVEIVDAISSGNAFIGHRKLVTIRGRLFEDGKEVGNFQGVRTSMGGFGGGFMSSCAVLERCTRALATDVTQWLKAPVAGARIGEQ